MKIPASKPILPFARHFWDEDIFSSLIIMATRLGMLAAKLILSLFMARYMGLAELGVYGLIVGASGIIQAILRGGVFALLSRDAVSQPISELAYHLRHYATGILGIYSLLTPVTFAAGWLFGYPLIALLALAVFLTEHLAFDSFVLINNLQYPKLANFVYSLQLASWIYLYVVFAFFYPELRSLEALLAFWIGGGLIAIAISSFLARGWPWKKTFANKIDPLWYSEKLSKSFKLYLIDVTGVVNYYMDRYIIMAFLSLEMTGVYVFFSQVVSATWNLVNSGVLVVFRPRLIKEYDPNNLAPFNRVYRSALKRAWLMTIALSILAALGVPFLVTLTDNEALLEHLPLLWLMLAALLFRVTATATGMALYAMHKDRENFIAVLIIFILTAIVGSMSVILLGLYGIVLNSAVVSIAVVFYARAVWNKSSQAKKGWAYSQGKSHA
jgi:O-antigen/teichoic acid export membrane protein